MSEAVPLESTGSDALTALPEELLWEIYNYLLPTHTPRKIWSDKESRVQAVPLHLMPLSATCSVLYRSLDAWALNWLRIHRDITTYREPRDKTSHQSQRPSFLTVLLKWTQKHCVFCGQVSVRHAIMMNGLHCCNKCDKREWPDKMTLTQVAKKYAIGRQELLTDRYIDPVTFRRVDKATERPRYGMYICQGVETTMFLKADVVEFNKSWKARKKAYYRLKGGYH